MSSVNNLSNIYKRGAPSIIRYGTTDGNGSASINNFGRVLYDSGYANDLVDETMAIGLIVKKSILQVRRRLPEVYFEVTSEGKT